MPRARISQAQIAKLKEVHTRLAHGPSFGPSQGWDKQDTLFIDTWLLPQISEVLHWAEGGKMDFEGHIHDDEINEANYPRSQARQ